MYLPIEHREQRKHHIHRQRLPYRQAVLGILTRVGSHQQAAKSARRQCHGHPRDERSGGRSHVGHSTRLPPRFERVQTPEVQRQVKHVRMVEMIQQIPVPTAPLVEGQVKPHTHYTQQRHHDGRPQPPVDKRNRNSQLTYASSHNVSCR